jgi:hypothetical protein
MGAKSNETRRTDAPAAADRGRHRLPARGPKPGRNYAATCAVLSFLLLASGLAGKAGNAPAGAILPVSPELCASMQAHNVINAGAPVDCSRLNLVRFPYVDFEGRSHGDGQIVVMDAVAANVLQIFIRLSELRFPIGKANLLDQYEGNDDASMADNNTSGFNARRIVGGNSLSMHAYGLAIDINPIRNPFARRAGEKLIFSPPSGIGYANRLNDRPRKNMIAGMAESVIDVFAHEGFLIWGGYWDDPIDYQHFQVSAGLAQQLARLPPPQAKATFAQYVERYRACRKNNVPDPGRSRCIRDSDANLAFGG